MEPTRLPAAPAGILAHLVLFLALSASPLLGQMPFTERFDDRDYASRGWYDGGGPFLSTAETIPGSASSAEFHFPAGATSPDSGGAMRRLFNPTESVYLSYYVKYSADWEGSNRPYHPHEFHFITDIDSQWIGPAYTHLTLYIEQNEGEPLLAIQDGQNVDEANIGVDLTAVTENRAVAGCNGDSDGYGEGDCYLAGSLHRNGKGWRAGQIFFSDQPGPFYKNDWHFVEAYFRLNSISAGIAVADGWVQYRFDGRLIMDYRDVVLRTGQWPNMRFNQFLMAPYIGDGSPVDQTMWVDELTMATDRVADILRNDEIATLVPLAPPLPGIFSVTQMFTLDYGGANRTPEAGEGVLTGVRGSEDDDDYYLALVPSGSTDPDTTPVVPDLLRPLILYQLASPGNTLRLIKSGNTLQVGF